jgi:LmbE family N-acetylglucosaminyl deacetylase
MKVLFTGAHPDDIEFCASGAIQYHHSIGDEIYCIIFSKCLNIPRNKNIMEEYEKAKEMLTSDVFGVKSIELLDYPNIRLWTVKDDIRKKLEEYRDNIGIDIVYTHPKEDINQDHLTLWEETMRVFRTKTVIGYESFWSEYNFYPNLFIPLTEEWMENKKKLIGVYESQKGRPYGDYSTWISALQIRGSMVNEKYAETFYIYREIKLKGRV